MPALDALLWPIDRETRCHQQIPETQATIDRGSFRLKSFGPPVCGAQLAYDDEKQVWACAYGHVTEKGRA